MDKKIVIFSVCVTVLVLFTSLTPVLASKNDNILAIKNNLVTIEVNKYLGTQPEQIHTTVTAAEAEQIKQYLVALHDALEKNDKNAISHYEALLNEKGIFGNRYQHFLTNDKGMALIEKTTLPQRLLRLADDNISNMLCYFNAIGEGILVFPFALLFLQAVIKAIQNVSNPIGQLILLLALLPLAILVILLTDLIPFRIAMPNGAIALTNGTISCLGLNGFQRVVVGTESYGVNISWFTGITISILPINDHKPFVFVSGIALKAEGQPI